ncbi:MAG: hypothetical protein PHP69_04760 [Candidatus Omnitrophica bacterium]|nr:hypothetical protein [Candidatus Omnitrophota bacterium]MDD5080410.1 hypothetical protein [Candidatus Omnitrophota bacterium]MDD5440704.1 hypothetical protein [Candidatus Omnitrophota bacterium]
MLAKVLGLFFIFVGIIWLLKPQACLDFIKKKMTKKIKFVLMALTFFVGAALIKIAFSMSGFLIKTIILVLGVLALIKGFLFLKKQAVEKMIEFASKLPLPALRVMAATNIIIGLYLFFIK